MKKFIALFLALALMLSLFACTRKDPDETDDNPGRYDRFDTPSDSDNTDEYTPINYSEDDISGYVTLGNYTGLTAEHVDPTLTDEEFIDYVNNVFAYYEDYEHIEDRPVAEGDTVIVDYSGSADGVQFQGGTAVNKEVIAADGTGYIPGFGPSLIGHMPGETYSVDITFPEDYQNNPDMAGVLTTFTFNVKYIRGAEKVAPTYDTVTFSFIEDHFTGFESVEDFLASQRETAEMQKSYTYLENMYRDLLAQIIESSEINLPEEEVNYGYNMYREMCEYYASAYQIDYDVALAYFVGVESDEALLKFCENTVKENLVFYTLARELEIETTDEEVNETINYIAKMYGVTAQEVVNQYGEDGMESQTLFDKVMAHVASLGTIVEVPEPTDSVE